MRLHPAWTSRNESPGRRSKRRPQGFSRPGGSPGVPQCRWVRGVQPTKIVQICIIIGLAPGVGRSPRPPMQSSFAGSGLEYVYRDGGKCGRRIPCQPRPRSPPSCRPSGRPCLHRGRLPCLAGMAATPQSWERPTRATAHARDGRDPAWS